MADDFTISPDLDERDLSSPMSDPFADELYGEPYADEFRKLSLNKLLHLAPYSEALLLNGAHGVGKSTLLGQFIGRASDSWRVANVSGNALMTSMAFLRQVAQGFGLHTDEIHDPDDLFWEINRYLQALGRSGRRAILVIDDAHLLMAEVLGLVDKILADERSSKAVSIVLAVDAEHEDRLHSFPKIEEKLAYTLNFEPFSESGTAGYIRHRLASAGRSEAETFFSPELVEEIYQQSTGLPGQINVLARLHLAKMSAKGQKGVAAPMRWALVGVGALAAVAVLLYQDEINRLIQGSPGEDIMIADHLATPESKARQENAAEAAKLVAGADKMPMAEKPEADSVAEPPIAATGQQMTVPAQASVAAKVEKLATGVEISAVDDSGAIEPRPIIGHANVASAPPVPESPVVAQAPQVEAPLAELKSVAKEAKKELKKIAVVAPAEKVAPQPKSASTSEQEKAKEWLMAQSPRNFTLQLMALQDEGKVRNFVKQNQIHEKSGTFQVNRKGKNLTVLVYGSYASRPDAEKAAKSLPKSWGLSKPWIRPFSSVHQDVQAD